jgi:hypothetical protein
LPYGFKPYAIVTELCLSPLGRLRAVSDQETVRSSLAASNAFVLGNSAYAEPKGNRHPKVQGY